MNRMFCIFLFISWEVANHFAAVRTIWVVKGIVLVVEGLNIKICMQSMTWPLEQNRRYMKYYAYSMKVRKGANIRNRYNQVPHLTQDTKWESKNHTI